jgi:hypothetical protein
MTLHPVLRASLLLYVYRLVASALVAYPVTKTLTAFGATMHADGDRSLFESGGFRLLESLRLGGPSLAAAAESGMLVGGFLAVLGLLPLAGCLTILEEPSRGSGDVAKHAVEHFPTFLKLGAATIFAQGIICAVAAAVAPTLSGFAGVIRNERTRDLVVVLALLPAGAAVLALGIWQDFARAAAVRGAARTIDAVRGGWAALVRRPAAALRAYAVTAAFAGAAVGVSTTAVSLVDVSRPGALRVIATVALHQAALLAIAALRVLWLSIALSRIRTDGPGGRGLLVDLDVTASRAVPAEVEPHHPAPQRT